MAPPDHDFARYCCELLGTVGPCVPKRMFGGFGISTDGLTLAIIADLGAGQTLWLKASERTRPLFEAEGCARFTYPVKGVPKSMNYYAAPAEALESPGLMVPWARLALEAAVEARANAKPKRVVAKKVAPAKKAVASKSAVRKK
ncbi:TfoX/Sxy family protein [Curvibacter sp. APW13]|uniref:TfoX/Sxy family protein n=1 Tax=Curvibacter sp. APW13 TaxID=3077236 RepID=UPI0028DF4EC6|nr:TfoX/Sxy family protein [Curvibacter sp. APW13]MDT8992690.1 TfoX/Sxy family protein [Curvibacter sp. APW13]